MTNIILDAVENNGTEIDNETKTLTPSQVRELLVLPVQELLTTQVMAYRGAVPPPDMVAAYEQILAGSTNRFLQIAEREQQRRIDNDKADAALARLQEENNKDNYRWGIVGSCGLMAVYLLIMLICVLVQAPVTFLTAMLGVPVLSAIAAIVTQFMSRQTNPKNEQKSFDTAESIR